MNEIDSYIQRFDPAIQKRLLEIRACIQAAAPLATEKISYAIPTFFLNKNLVHFAGYQNHVGFYPGVGAILKFQTELSSWKTSKGGIQFPHNRPLPLDIISSITRFRIEENLYKQALKKSPKKEVKVSNRED